jgi:protein-tyrosine kinase
MGRIHDALKKAQAERAKAGDKDRARREGGGEGAETHSREPAGSAAIGLGPARPADVAGAAHLPLAFEELLSTGSSKSSWKPDTTRMLFFDGNARAKGREQFRTLRSRLLLLRNDRAIQKVLVSSPMSKEGKTFIAANLAQAFAQQAERRVLLVDADLRASDLYTQFGTSHEPGLTDYLRGEVDEIGAIQRAPLANLFFVPAGRRVENPSELIGNGRLKTFLGRVADRFDWIVLDSPPVMTVSDAKLLGEYCDGVLMVIAAGATPIETALKACQEFRKDQLLGVVLNRTETRPGYSGAYDNGKSPEGSKGLESELR